jgi:hypothetical protein
VAQPPFVADTLAPLKVPDGLFAAVGEFGGLIDNWNPHYANAGAIWVPDTCVPGEVAPAPCQAPPYTQFVMDAMDSLAQAWPFVAYATLDTAAVGFSAEEAARRVEQRLVNYEQNIAERAFWGTSTDTTFAGITNYAGTTAPAAGVAGVNGGILQQLANAGAAAGFHDLSGSAVSLVEGISMLEQSLADNYYGEGFIHMRPRMAAYMGLKNQFKFVPVPPIEQTWNEDVLVFGNGYAGTGKTGAALAGTVEFIWATGRVCVWRAPDIWVSPPDQLLNRNTNQRGLYAFRPYMIGVECFSAVVQVDRALPTGSV